MVAMVPMKKLLVFFSLMFIGDSCILPSRNMQYKGLAKRSDIVLQVVAISVGSRRADDRYKAKFRITGTFSDKFARFKVNDRIRLGLFGSESPCVPVEVDKHYIVFIRGVPMKKRTGFSKYKYSMRFNPVPLTDNNLAFFGGIISGEVNDLTTKRLLSSGCPTLRKPLNGRVTCTEDWKLCSIKCGEGFQLSCDGGSVKLAEKACGPTTGQWEPSGRCNCIEPGTETDNNSNEIKPTKKPRKERTTPKSARKPWRRRNGLIAKSQSDEARTKPPRKRNSARDRNSKSSEEKPARKPSNRRSSTRARTRESNAGGKSNEKAPRRRTTGRSGKASKSRAEKRSKTAQRATEKPLPAWKIRRQRRLRLRALTSEAPPTTTNAETTTATSPTTTNAQTTTIKRVFITRTPPVRRILRITTPRPFRASRRQSGFSGLRPTAARAVDSISKLKKSEGLTTFGESVIGCPTINGYVKIFSIWKGGFNGMARFDELPQTIRDGWVVRVTFNVPLRGLDTFTVDPTACDRTKRSYCLIPKEYAETVDSGSNLTVSFTGDMRGISVAAVRGNAQLMGVCQTERTKNRPFRDLIPAIEKKGNINENALQKGENGRRVVVVPTSPSVPTVGVPTRVARPGRCSALADNGNVVKTHVAKKPQWKKLNRSGVDYNEILHKSILFYEAQRSGRLPDDNRVPWRGDADMKDGCSINHDLSGGWYNSGGNVKTTLLTAFSTTLLAWGAIDYKDAYVAAGEYEQVLDQIRWAADYLIKCRISPYELVVQVGDYFPASSHWKRPEESTQSYRKVYVAHKMKPAGAVAAETAAALAAVSILFAQSDRKFSETCLTYAIDLYTFAKDYPEHYPYNPRSRRFWYNSRHGSQDELAWAGAWLNRATQEEEYLNEAENMFKRIVYTDANRYHFSLNQKATGIVTLLAGLSKKSKRYKRALRQFTAWTINDATKTPQGLLYLNAMAPNMYAANSAFLCLQAARVLRPTSLTRNATQFAKQQMKILIGADRQGYVVGIGPNAPERPHHRGSTCPPLPAKCYRTVIFQNKPNANPLYGAVVGGPTGRGRYFDRASDYIRNNVRIDFNAGFQSLAAGLLELKLQAEE